MSDSCQDRRGETGEDTDELLYSDLDEEVTPAQKPRDHCDLLLDAIDAQLSRLQPQSHAVRARGDDGNCKIRDCTSTALSLSQAVSKDTGLGSTIPTNDTSTSHLDMAHSEIQDLSSEKGSGNRNPNLEEEEEEGAVVGMAEEGAESKREQCRWRLERLLGGSEGGLENSPPRAADSVCTEDFALRFREEMLEPLVPVGVDEDEEPESGSSGEEHPLHGGEEAGGTYTLGVQGTECHPDPRMDFSWADSGEIGVGVEELRGYHLGGRRASRQDRDSPQSAGVLLSRVGWSQGVDRRARGAKRTDSSGETGPTAWRGPLGLHEQSRQAHPLHSHITPAGHDTGQSDGTTPNLPELSRLYSPQRCEKPSLYQEFLLTGRGSISMTDLTDSTLVCIRTIPGAVSPSRGTDQTNAPCTGGTGGVTVAPLKHSPEVIAEEVNGSGIRILARSLSCPATTPEAIDSLGKTLDKARVFSPSPSPSPAPFSLPRFPLRDAETSLCAPPTGGRSSMGQRMNANNDVPSQNGQPCSHSALPDCSSGGPSEVLSGTAPRPPSSACTSVLTVSRSSFNTVEAEDEAGPTVNPAVRHLAGVPVKSFDSVTIDSDLDSVRTDRVRKHFLDALRCSAVVRSARGLCVEDLCTDQSDPELLLEPRPKFSLQALRRNVPCGSRFSQTPRHTRRDTPRYACSDDEETDEVEEEEAGLSGLHTRGPVQRNSAPWRRRSNRVKGLHLRTLTGGRLQEVESERLLLEEALAALRQNCLREEERLGQKRAQLCDMELSLTALQQHKKHAMQELDCVRAAVERAEREGRGLEVGLRDSRAQADSTRSQLRMLQSQRDGHLQEMSDLEQELTALRRHKSVLQERTGAEVERRLQSSSLSVLEREEMDRQLDSAKTELFAEQRRARHKLDSLQERLEETQQELDQCVEEVRVLRESHTGLEEQLTDVQRQKEDLEQRRMEEAQAHVVQVRELQGRLEEQGSRAGALEHILAQKELQLLGAQEQQTALRGEKRSLEVELLSLKEEHCAKLRDSQEQAQRDKELELEQLRSELGAAGEQEVQQVLRRAEEEKREALREQALSLAQHSDALQTCIQRKEEELAKLKGALEREQESARKRMEELRTEAQETARQAVEQEERKWEAEKGEELRQQRAMLEDQGRRVEERVREETEREKRNSLALQNKVVELQTRLQELESEGRLHQREHAAALTAVRGALREEQEAELQRLRRHLEQEGQREVSRLRQAVERAERETHALQAALAERGRSQEEGVFKAEQQQRGWATELGAECQRVRELLERCGTTGGAASLPHNPTVAQVVQTLRAMREQLYTLVSRLQQDLDSQRHAVQQLARDKERELRIQREQLAMEREQALDSLRERLIQDHIEELSTLQRAQLRENHSESGGVAASLRRQLQDKDGELREVQRSMGRWKEQTAARLARKFEEELTAELERCKAELLKERRAPRARMDQQRKLQRLESEMRWLTTEYGEQGMLHSTSSPSLLSVDPPATPGPPDLATFKLLRHLQSRVRQLRAENSACSPLHLGTHLGTGEDLAGSYLETIAPCPESCRARSRSHARTVQS